MMLRSRAVRWRPLAGAVLLAASLTGCSNEPSAATASRDRADAKAADRSTSREGAAASDTEKLDSHARMLRTLQEIKRKTADNHPFLGSRALREAQAEVRPIALDAVKFGEKP